ncbi:MAG: PilZ domain-containing protein [Gammaproteobacteria bacterium]|nr:MAG: PilZ domain-containing protein [Gammaproteobacteria bacterium]
MRDYEEKRRFLRMATDCSAWCRILETAEELEVRLCDLSSGGVGLVSERPLAPGCRFEIRIAPEWALVPPLHALAEVVHARSGADGCRAGARILEMLGS